MPFAYHVATFYLLKAQAMKHKPLGRLEFMRASYYAELMDTFMNYADPWSI